MADVVAMGMAVREASMGMDVGMAFTGRSTVPMSLVTVAVALVTVAVALATVAVSLATVAVASMDMVLMGMVCD